MASIINRIAIDVASKKIQHVQLDEQGRFKDIIKSGLNRCLTIEANIDQTGRAFIQDAVESVLGEGFIALVPVDTTIDFTKSDSYEIKTMRVAQITAWYPQRVKLRLWNDRKGQKQEITLDKNKVAIIENPLYSVMNAPNSTLKRLEHKLALLDAVDEQSSSGKLDLIIQLPYIIKSEARQQQANDRKKAIEEQLKGSKYGIAYTDAAERITQLNRPAENNLMSQIEYLTSMLYSQLGLTSAVFDGTAKEEEMLNYYNRTIEPILSALADGMIRSFLTENAQTRGQSIMFFNDAFRLTTTEKIADIADKFTRNAILSSNELRSMVGYKPVDDPDAEALRNKNLNQSNQEIEKPQQKFKENGMEGGNQNGS